MAAETVDALSFKSDPVKLWEGGKLTRAHTHPSSTDLGEAGDIIRFYQMPRTAKILDGMIQAPELDTGNTIVVSAEITDGTTTKTLIDGTNIAQAGGLARPGKTPVAEDAIGWVVPDDGYVARLIVDTGATGEQAGEVFFSVDYTVDTEYGDVPP